MESASIATGRLTAYGHSWVAGEGASEESLGFGELAAHRLGMVADNRGVGGSSTPETAGLIARHPPPGSELYVVMSGLNDARRDGADPRALEVYGVALASIFEGLARANPASVIVAVEQPHLLDYSLHPPHHRGSNEVLDAYNDRLRAVASDSPCVVLASVTGWDPATMLTDDTVHPNDAGHARMTQAVLNASRPES